MAEAFEQAAVALTAIVTDAEVAENTSVEVACEARDVELLFVEWLNAIIYEMAVRNMVFGQFKVAISDMRLQGTMWGEPIDQVRHAPACEPKARLTPLCAWLKRSTAPGRRPVSSTSEGN
jgi:SHS2 domain-containing protein